VVLRREPGAGRRDQATTAPRGTTTIDLGDFLAGAQQVSAVAAAARSSAIAPEDISDLIFHLGHDRAPQRSHGHPRPEPADLRDLAAIVGLRHGDRYLVVNPFFHTFGYKAGLLASLMSGATVVPEPVFDVDRVLERIETEHITVLPGPPTLYQSILVHSGRAAHDLSSLRLGVTGAAVVPVALVVAMRDDLGFDTVLTAYGLTESCGTVTMCRRSDPPRSWPLPRAGPFPASRCESSTPRARRSVRASRVRSWCAAIR